MIQRVLNSIAQRQRFVLTSHARPDGDAIGSVLAACQILRGLGKEAEVVLSDAVPVIYRPLPFAETVARAEMVNGKYDAAIILECDSVQRTRLLGLEEHDRLLINIDHHDSAKPFAHVNWIDTTACATAEMIYELARAANARLTPEIATCLYTAVLADTGSFCFQGTGERTFELARQLVRAGADPVRLAQNVYFSNPESKMRLLGVALGNLRRAGALAWMHVTQAEMRQCGAVEEDCEGLVNYAIGISGVEAAVFFRELSDSQYHVSMRSKGAVNVAGIAESFNGGGHACASGCSIAGPLAAATEKIIARFDEMMRAK